MDEIKQNLAQLLPDTHQSQHAQISSMSGYLSGRQIQHRWIVEGECEWFSGTILGKVDIVESSNTLNNILYDGEDSIVTLDINEDIEAGDIILL